MNSLSTCSCKITEYPPKQQRNIKAFDFFSEIFFSLSGLSQAMQFLV